jgi:hypothetical protein
MKAQAWDMQHFGPICCVSVMTCNIFGKPTKTVIGIHANKLNLAYLQTLHFHKYFMQSFIRLIFVKKFNALTLLLSLVHYFKSKRINTTNLREVEYSSIFYYSKYSYLI